MERELDTLRGRLLLMGGEVELALQRAMHALTRRDTDVANQVIENDRVIDRLELEIDRLSVEVLTLCRPVRTHRLYEGSGFYQTSVIGFWILDFGFWIE